jgi:hypothetical protein
MKRALGGPEGILDDFPNRPKGVHRSTYDRRRERCEAYEVPVLEGMVRLLALLSR